MAGYKNKHNGQGVVTTVTDSDYVVVNKTASPLLENITLANLRTAIASGIALIEKIVSNEATIALFAAASGGYTYQQGDIIVVTNGTLVTLYMYVGGTKTDVANYLQIDVDDIEWANLLNVPAPLTELATNDVIYDKQATPELSANFNTRNLTDNTGQNSLNYQTRLLFDPSGVQSVEWEERQLKNELGNVEIDWNLGVMTHSALLALKTAGTLIPGKKYTISDFKTKYTQPVTNLVKEAATVETLVLTATSTSTFDVRVQSVEYPKDIIEYDIDDITCEAPNEAETRKGKIIYRKDDVNNITYYDHRTVLFRRWLVDAVLWESGTAYVANDVIKDTVNGNIYKCIKDTSGVVTPSSSYDWVLWMNAGLFQSWDSDKNNFTPGGITPTNLIINNVIENVDFKDVLTFGTGCCNNTIGKHISYNNIIFVADNSNNSFGNENYNNSFGNDNSYNSFGNGNSYNSFGNDNYGNSFGNENSNNSFGNYNSNNSFGNENSNNSFGNDNYYNSFGNGFNGTGLTFGANAITLLQNTAHEKFVYKDNTDGFMIRYFDNSALVFLDATT
jgi:hypothetical protein